MVCTSKKRLLGIFLFASVLLFAQNALCQDRNGLFGIGVQLSTPPLYNSPVYQYGSMEMQPDILLSAWVTDKIALEPSIGIIAYTNFTFWRLGLSVVRHFSSERIAPFVAFRAKTFKISANGLTGSDYLIGVAYGGEYFISEKFSISGEVQLNYTVPDKARSLLVRRNTTSTGVGISGRFYLN